MRSVPRDEVHQGRFVPQIVRVIGPVQVWLEPSVLGQGEELPPGGVQRRDPHIAATRDIEGAEIERQPDEVVLQRPGGEFVNLVGDCPRDPADHSARALFRRELGNAVIARVIEGERIEEGLEQAQLSRIGGRSATYNGRGIDGLEIAVIAIHRLGQHGVAEAIDRL